MDNNNDTTIRETEDKFSQQKFEVAKREINELIAMTSLSYEGKKLLKEMEEVVAL